MWNVEIFLVTSLTITHRKTKFYEMVIMILHPNMSTCVKLHIHFESLELFNQIKFFSVKIILTFSFLTLGDKIRQNLLIE